MPIFSNNFVFPALQLALLALLLWALWRDYASRGGGITVRRGPESMDVLQRATGLKFFATATELYNLWLRIPTIATLLVERTR